MVGSAKPRMLGIAAPHVQAWNVWFSQFGNTPEGFAQVVAEVHEICAGIGCDPGSIEATAAILVEVPGGAGRQMGHPDQAQPLRGTRVDIAAGIRAYAAAGARHLQLVVDPITEASIEWLGDVLALLDRDG